MLKRKIDDILLGWKEREGHKPLIVKGARQIGKTESIRKFGRENYPNVIEINFVLQKGIKVSLTMDIFNTYKGAIYENIVGDMLIKAGYDALYFYRDDKSSVEMDFFVRNVDSLIPVEVKANDSATASLNKLTDRSSGKYPDVHFGVKLCRKNIGFNGKFYTFPISWLSYFHDF